MNFRKSAVLAMGCVVLAGGTVALAASAGDVVSARQANFKAMGKAMKGSFDELKQPAPSIDVFKTNANTLAGAATKIAAGFPKGTGPESGVKTQALPALWEKPDEFRAATDKFAKAAQAYSQAAASGNLDATKAALMQVGGTCKGCHDSFRAKDL